MKNAFISTFQVDDNLMYYYSYYYQYHFYYYHYSYYYLHFMDEETDAQRSEVFGKATQQGHLRTNKNPELWLH